MARDPGQPPAAVRGVVAALLGGVIGWTATFSGLGPWGLVIGLVGTVLVIFGLARPPRARAPLSVPAAYAFAFILLTWPLLWLLVGYIRYVITGESLGD
jgi:hypothetical protein